MSKQVNVEDLDNSFSGIVSRYQDDRERALVDLGLMFEKAIDLDCQLAKIELHKQSLRSRKSQMIGGIKNMADHLKIKVPFSINTGGKIVSINEHFDLQIIPIINA